MYCRDTCRLSFLVANGAKNDCKDAAGNTPSNLAERAGRRASKELIEEKTGTKEGGGGARERRRSRDSAEPPPAVGA